MIKNKFFMHPTTKISFIIAGILGCIGSYKFYFKQYINFFGRKEAEKEANILYEKLRKKEVKLSKIKYN